MDRQIKKWSRRVPKHFGWFAGMMVAVLVCAVPASGQFMLQPMKVELAPRAGQRLIFDLRVQNTSGEKTQTIDLQIRDLMQLENGDWTAVDPGSNFDTSKLASCKDWMRLRHENVRMRPMTQTDLSVAMMVPSGARGFYGAVIVATMRERLEVKGVGFILEVLVPVLVQIEGWTPRHRVELTDVGLQLEQQADKPGTTFVTLGVANSGKSFSRLKGLVRVNKITGEVERKITDAELTDVSILPGSQLNLQSDISRSLPSGRYKLEAWLYVDGRRAKPMVKEVDFVGDPRITRAATDAALDLSPSEVSVDTLPGAMRTAILRVFNASNETVNVWTDVTLPPVLDGVALGELRGEDLNCVSWVQVTPAEFSLRARGMQSLRIITNMPNPKAMHPCYYALLRLFARYPDGQNAGVTKAYICVGNQKAQAQPSAQSWGVTIEELGEESKYVVKSTFINNGNVHFTPTCKATVSLPDGRFFRQVVLSSQPAGPMLPLEPRVFSEVIDFAPMASGYYRLTVSLDYGADGQATKDIPILVEAKDSRKFVTNTTTEEFVQKVGVAW
jgi:hypothetical protein